MRKTFKFRLYPTHAQASTLQRALNACRWVYNKTLEVRKSNYESEGKSLSLYDTNALLTGWKKEHDFLKQAHSQCLQNAQLRVDLAFQAFFRRVKAGQTPGYPRFKGADRYDSLTFPQCPSGCKVVNGHLVVSKVGEVRMVQHRAIEGSVKTATITRSNGKWFVCLSCDNVEPRTLERLPTAVGIDVGLESFATLSTDEKIANPRFFRKDEKALASAQRKLSKLSTGSPQRSKAKKVVGRIHERIRNRRYNFAHQEARKIVNRFGAICVEDLAITRMLQHHGLAKSISDAAWGKFLACLSSKAEEAGRRFIEVDPRGTSQQCSRCGSVVKKDLSIRVHACPVCSLQIDRDLNAAYNIVSLGLQTAGVDPSDRIAQEAASL